jgi:hypothetical protein
MVKKRNLIEEVIKTHILPEDPNEEPILLSRDMKDALGKTQDAKDLRDKPYLTTDMMSNNINSVEFDVPIDIKKLMNDMVYLETVIHLFLDQMVIIARKDFKQDTGVFNCSFTDKVLKFIDAKLKIIEIQSKMSLLKGENQEINHEEDEKLLTEYFSKNKNKQEEE